MKKIILPLCLFFCIHGFSQKSIEEDLDEKNENTTQQFSFYVRIPNINNLPNVLSKSNNRVYLHHKNAQIQTVFNKYHISEFIQAFPTAKTHSLKETYLIKSNSIQLMDELRNRFPQVYTFAERTYENVELLAEPIIPIFFTPNDYGLEVVQTNLDLINGKLAWDYTTGSSSVVLGIVDTEFNVNHIELAGTISFSGINSTFEPHGTGVASIMAGNTNNGIGLSSIGYNCFINAYATHSIGNFTNNLNQMLLMSQSNIEVINGSWGQSNYFVQTHKNLVDEIYSNGTVLIFAAGNTPNNTTNFYPAAYDNVISVTSIHHKDFMQPAYDNSGNFIGNVLRKKDTHDSSWVWQQKKDGSHNHTYSVDIAAPGYDVPILGAFGVGYGTSNGTSNAAPQVTGTIGLMKSVNNSLSVEEIVSILKITSANIYQIPENANYIDKLGAGRLDAGKAVEMAYKMAQPQDSIIISDRDFYRDWTFVLKNAPYGIKIDNEIFRDSIKVDFTARNFIELENTVLEPNSFGYTSLSIDPSAPLPTVLNNNSTNVLASNQSNNNNLLGDSEFIFSHYLVDNEKEEVNLSSNESIPTIKINLNKEKKVLETVVSAFCNGTSVVYKDKGEFLEVISRGTTTLSQCSNDDNRFFKIVSGNVYMQNPAQKVYYSLTSDNKGLWLWVDVNEKLYFTRETLSLEEQLLSNLITVYPNPSSNFINIDSGNISLKMISIIDGKGNVLIKRRHNLNNIDVSKLAKGLYFLKMTTSKVTITKKIVVE